MHSPENADDQNSFQIFLRGNFSYKGTYFGKDDGVLLQGDIVRWLGKPGSVEWDEGAACFRIMGNFEIDTFRYIKESEYRNMEVIGNIHENPELLK